VCSYSTFVRRRRGTRPSARCFFMLIAVKECLSDLFAAAKLFSSGRSSDAGGMSPESTRSKICTHFRKVALSDRSLPRVSKLRLVSVAESWQSRHDDSIKGLTPAMKVCAATTGVAKNIDKLIRNRFKVNTFFNAC